MEGPTNSGGKHEGEGKGKKSVQVGSQSVSKAWLNVSLYSSRTRFDIATYRISRMPRHSPQTPYESTSENLPGTSLWVVTRAAMIISMSESFTIYGGTTRKEQCPPREDLPADRMGKKKEMQDAVCLCPRD